MVITYYFAKTRALKYTTADYITMHVKQNTIRKSCNEDFEHSFINI